MGKGKNLTVLFLCLGLLLSGCAKWPPQNGPATDDGCVTILSPGPLQQFVTGFCGILSFFCSSQQVDIQVPHTPEIDLSGYETIAFTKIEGNYGEAFAASFKEQLQKKSKIKVVDRTQLQKILNEQGKSENDLFDPNFRVTLGKLLPAGVIVTGKIDGNFQSSPPINPQMVPCPYDTKKTCTLNTVTGRATMKGTISIIDVETSQHLKDKRLHHSEEDSNTAFNQLVPEPIDQEALHEKNLKVVVSDMTKASVHWTETRSVVFFTHSDIPKIERGVLEAKSGKLEGAEKIFSEAIAQNEGNPDVSTKALAAARFNLAVVKAYRGEYDEAERLLSLVMDDTLDAFPAALMRKVIDCLKEENAISDGGSE